MLAGNLNSRAVKYMQARVSRYKHTSSTQGISRKLVWITWKEQHLQEINLQALNIHFKHDRDFIVLVIMTLDEALDLAILYRMSLSNSIDQSRPCF